MGTIMDPAVNIYPVPGGTALTIVAGDTQDGTEQTGLVVDRQSVELEQFKGHFGVTLVVMAQGVALATDETLTIIANLEDDTLLAFSSPVDFAPAVTPVGDHPAVSVGSVLTAAAGAVTGGRVVLTHSYDIHGADRWIRLVYTATFSASGTDTADFTQQLIFHGFREQPVGPLSGTRATLIA